MRVCGVGGCVRGHARGLLVGAPQPQASGPLLVEADGAQARLERAMAATTTVIFVFSVSYIALSTIFGCFCTDGAETGPQAQRPAAAVAEDTKRALEEIPVVVVQVMQQDPAGSGSGGAGAGAAEEEPGECAVCLAEYAGGEEVRMLPACCHGFHRECVDRWLLTRAPTCPMCRALVAAQAEGPDAKV